MKKQRANKPTGRQANVGGKLETDYRHEENQLESINRKSCPWALRDQWHTSDHLILGLLKTSGAGSGAPWANCLLFIDGEMSRNSLIALNSCHLYLSEKTKSLNQ